MQKIQCVMYETTFRPFFSAWMILLFFCLGNFGETSRVLVNKNTLSLGFDFGTSGVRCCCINSQDKIIFEDSLSWAKLQLQEEKHSAVTDVSASNWITALELMMHRIPAVTKSQINRLTISGTSGSVLLYDTKEGSISRRPRMYDFNVLSKTSVGNAVIEKISKVCPKGSPTNAATSTLAKVLAWNLETPILHHERIVHQADYIASELTCSSASPRLFRSDWHNSLKLGFDVHSLRYPDWLIRLLEAEKINPSTALPLIIQPGHVADVISKDRAIQFGLPTTCEIIAGTTDSIAAFLAAGVEQPGQAVTSLGSTLAVKMLSLNPVQDSSRGIYSHRLGDLWLVGGASNVGCKILRQEGFTSDELVELSNFIDPSEDPPYSYYPLCAPGERFPTSDPFKQPMLEPRPPLISRQQFLQGILHSIGTIEAQAYQALQDLGSSPLSEVLTCGGGAQNDVWTSMRQRLLGAPVRRAANVDAAFGCARLGLMYAEGQQSTGQASQL